MSDVMLKDDLEKVLAELETQGVDITAIKNALANSGGMKVKRIQTGRSTITNTGSGYVTVSIEEVDLQKSICFSSGGFYQNNNYAQLCGVRFKDAATLEVLTNSAYNASTYTYADWFVIEFE